MPTRSDIIKRAQELDVDPKFALSIWSQESSGNFNSPDSDKGARGGFQVIPGTYKSMMGTDEGQRDPWNNMEAGLRYIRYGQDTLKTRDPELLAAGYHAGYDRKDLKSGRLPGPEVNDGHISSADYARQMAARVRGEAVPKVGGVKKSSVTDGFEPITDPATLKQYGMPIPGVPDGFEPVGKEEADNFNASQNGNVVTDFGRNLKIGADIAAQDMRELVGKIPLVGDALVKAGDSVDEYFSGKKSDKLLADDVKQQTERLTPEMQGALEKKWWDSKKGTFGDAWTDWRSYAGGVVQSLPEQAATMVPAMRLAKAAYASKIASGATVEVASQAAARAAMITGGLTEGALGGAQASRSVRDEVMALKPDILAQSDAYNSLLKSGMDAKQAQTALAENLSTRAFVTSGLVTGLFGGMGDRVIARILTKEVGGSVIKRVFKGAAEGIIGEGLLEEVPQSAGQQIAQNEAVRQANPNKPLMEDVPNQALGGFALGGVQGGGMGGVAGARNKSQPEPVVPGATPAQAAPAAAAPAPAPAPITPTPNAPSTASGPLQRATENAAVKPDRVTVTTPDGQVSGAVVGTSTDGVVQVADDNGEVFNFKVGENGISITPEVDNTPLTNAREAASLSIDKDQPAPEQPVAAQTEQPAAPPAEPAPSRATIKQMVDEQAANAARMSDEELRDNLNYIVNQAKTNGGWSPMLIKARGRVEDEIASRQAPPAVPETVVPPAPAKSAAAETAPVKLPVWLAGAKPRYAFGDKQFELKFASDIDRAAYIAAQDKPSKRDAEYLAFAMQNGGMNEADVRAHGAQVRAAIKAMAKDAGPGTLKVAEVPRGGVTIEKTPTPAAEPAPTTSPSAVEFAQEGNVPSRRKLMQLESVKRAREVDAEGKSAGDDPLVRALSAIYNPLQANDKDAQIEALSYGQENGRPDIVAEARANLAKLADKLEREAASDTTTPAVPETSPKHQKIKADLEARKAKKGTDAAEIRARLSDKKPAAPAKPKTASKEDVEHLFGVDKKRAAALERIAKGTAFFGDKAKAQDFITKNGLKDTHEVVQTGKVRFEVKAKKADEFLKSPDNAEWERFSHKGTTVDFERNGKSAAIFEIISKNKRAGEARDALLILKSQIGKLTAEGVVEDSKEAISFWQKMLNEGVVDSATLTNGTQLFKEASNGRNNDTSRKPASAEAVVEKADGNEAAAAAVQPDAEEAQGQVGERLPNATAPEQVIGVDDRELSQISAEFNEAQASMMEGDQPITNIFQQPKKGEIVRLADKAKIYHKEYGWMTPAEARERIAEWKKHAKAQGKDPKTRSANSQKVVLSLFDLSGEWSKPWEEAGYQVYRFDIQADPDMGDVNNFSTEFFSDWFGDFDGMDIHAILAACPCTDFAVSGARHFAAKDKDGRTVSSVNLVHQTLRTIEYFKPAVWALENPVGRIESLGGLPNWRLSFDPNHLGDTYTKKTLIWGRFNGDLPVAPVEPTEGSKMWSKYGGKSQATKNARSVTPEGFSYGFFMANNAIDHPAMAVANKFDRLNKKLIEQAIDAGVTPDEIENAVEDFYYMDLDDDAANQAIRDLMPEAKPELSPATKARNDLMEMEAKLEEQGRIVDARLVRTIEQQKKLIADLDSEANLANKPDPSAELLDRIAKAYGFDDLGKMPAGLSKTATKLRDALIKRDSGMLQQILHPSNQSSRKAFETLFAGKMKLPKGVAGTDQVIADFFGQVNTKIEAAAATAAPAQFSDNKIFTQSAVDKARARLKSKLSQLNSGIDPEMMIDGMTIAGAYLESGVRSFSAYAKAMTADFGDAIKPYLLSFYEGARNYPGLTTAGMDSVEDARTEHEALLRTTEITDATEKLDEPRSRELEGAQSDAVQGAQSQREAGSGAEGRSGTDLLGDVGAGSSRTQQSGRVGNDAGEVPAATSGTDGGRRAKSGRGAVQRSDKSAKRDPSIDAGGSDLLTPQTGTRAQDRSDNFVIGEDDAIGEGGAKTKFKQNIAAIKLLKELVSENRQATRAEQAVLAKYVGWGGIPQAFYRDNNEVTKGWEKEAAELKGLMTADELAAAATSTRNAHYTSPEIVSAVWDAAKHFGFQGGRVLEPSVGVGNFFGLMPSALRSASQLTGVELDHITGGIAKQLYPQANINAPVGFQNFASPDGYFDLAIGNPPFGREGIYDPTRKKISNFSIHNYFFAKSIDTVKPNGVLAMVVTNRLLDSAKDKARSYIADRAEFLGAIRLPNDAFLKNAGTQVTTDIIFLRKLNEGEQPKGESWMDVKQYKDASGKLVPLNEYFVKHPDMMLGDFGAYGSMYSPDEPALLAKEGQDTPALLQAAITKLPQGFMDGPTAEPTRETITSSRDISSVKVGSVFEQDGKIFERREDMLGSQQAAPVVFTNERARERVTGMIGVRDALVAVRGLQLTENASDNDLAAARAALNKTYDAFVKANGPLNIDANKRLMRDDPSWPQIAALEDKFDKGITKAVAKTTGETPREPSAQKAAIFTKRTQAPYKAPESASSAKDAMVSSLAERGRVDLDYMASLYAGHTPDQIAQELEGLIFKNPAGGWESRDAYLSGNVKKKLAQAIEAAKADPSLKANIDALKAVQPADIEAVDIDVKTGAHWIPADVMQGFITHISEGQNAKAVYNPVNASWTLNVERIPQSAQTQWSTDRATLTSILEAAANQKQIVIRDKQTDGSSVLNEVATTAANEKVERVKTEWKSWIWQDDARRERLARIYNDTFNTDVQRDFDGSHLTFPGKVGNDIISLRPHQANAIWRMVQSGTTLLDHVVGAGKTFTMIGGIMEMRRMGLAKKPMLVVPNHLVGQWAEDFMKLYPGANILAATKKDFEKDNRKKLFARIATGDWDAVIVAHSSFGKVEVEPEFQEQFIKQQIADMDTSIAAMRTAEGKGSRNVKQIEKQKTALEEKLKKLFDTGSKDDNLYFNELGVDAVLLDEAHEFKNLGFSTGMQRVAGLGNAAGSNKAADMFMKVQSVLKRTGGKNVVFATGTPISNTMAEMYTMQRFLDYGTLKDQGIAHFDAWAKTFGEVVTDWELSPSGQYKMNSRFAKFVNMPELMQRYGSFADVINRDDINRQLALQGKKLPVPKVASGKPENVVVARSTDQANYIGVPRVLDNGAEEYPQHSLIYRSEHLPKGPALKGADNMLKIMSDARKAALDMRLIDPSYPDNPDSKVNVSAGNIKGIYDKWTPQKGAQLVFIDLSTPKGAKAKEAAALRELVAKAAEGDEAAQEKLDAMSPDELMALDGDFSVYDDLKAKLIARGIPENEIAFIHDANTELQKEELFAKVRSGRVRVLFGSTAKMGAGMNVQERLVALHHLDAPWRPSDLEQREGRIIRQGNALYDADPENFEIRIMRYATKQTLDSRMWQTIEAKARFIEQVRKGTGEREVEDVAGEAANSAEMKAASSGNPLILEEMTLRQSIRKMENKLSEHNREQYRIKDRMRMLGEQAERLDRDAAKMAKDAPLAPKEFSAKIGQETFDKHGEAGQAILDAARAMYDAGDDGREIGSYGGFKLRIDDASRGQSKETVLTLEGSDSYQIEANMGSSPSGLALRMQNTVKTLAADAAKARAQAERNRADVPKLQAQVGEWNQKAELADAKAKHAAVIEQLKPKKQDKPAEAKPEEANPAFSRSSSDTSEIERIFAGLNGKKKARLKAEAAMENHPDAAAIQYVDENFWNILGELEESKKVSIKC